MDIILNRIANDILTSLMVNGLIRFDLVWLGINDILRNRAREPTCRASLQLIKCSEAYETQTAGHRYFVNCASN